VLRDHSLNGRKTKRILRRIRESGGRIACGKGVGQGLVEHFFSGCANVAYVSSIASLLAALRLPKPGEERGLHRYSAKSSSGTDTFPQILLPHEFEKPAGFSNREVPCCVIRDFIKATLRVLAGFASPRWVCMTGARVAFGPCCSREASRSAQHRHNFLRQESRANGRMQTNGSSHPRR
jgi:hypothetical protein